MTQDQLLQRLIALLLDEMPQYRAQATQFPNGREASFRLFRSLVNVRLPIAASREFLALQNEYLQQRIAQKGKTKLSDLTPVHDDCYLWQGDITTLAADGIVNAANSGMLGCFCPCHGCIDNAIHTYAGVQLRIACAEIMRKQGYDEPTGQAKITPAFNLPCNYVLHTVGPIISGGLTQNDCDALASCYRSCLSLADDKGLTSIAFCCISTGAFQFPNEQAAETAIQTVNDYKKQSNSKIKVIYTVFKDYDYEIYQRRLGADRTIEK